MIYLSYVWKIFSSSSGMNSIIIGNMLIFFYFLRPRFKWWLYPVLVSITYFALPIIYKLNTLLSSPIPYSILMTSLGYWNILLILVSFRESFLKTFSLIFTLGILNRLFTFLGYILYITSTSLVSIDIKMSITLVISLMYTIISIICWFILKDNGRKLIQTKLHRGNWGILLIISISAKLIIDFCSDYVFNLNPYSHIKIILAMIALSTFVILVLILYIYSTITTMKHLELKASTAMLTFEKEAQQRYYETQLHNQNELRRIKHDIKGNLNTISSLLLEDNKEEALLYLAELSDYNERHQKVIYSEDPYLNAVVTNYATIFKNNHIKFEQDIQLVKMNLPHVEMCLVLNNALQNSLEASLKLLPEQRYVRLQVKTKQNHFLFRISNRFNNEIIMDDSLPHSTKTEDGHGYGLMSIKSAVESVGGFIITKVDGDMFILDISM